VLNMASQLKEVCLKVNGEEYHVSIEPRMLLSDVLRDVLRLTGTHVGCEHGICGACTILIDGRPMRSCLMLGIQAQGMEILTVEGLAKEGEPLHPIQEAFWENHGLQCGFCTPGFIMTILHFLEENPSPTRDEIKEGIAGNLCRCTGYQTIVDSVEHAAEIMRKERTVQS